jgi:5-methyltetrahydrofolate--homocysteine methyltransferase
MSDILEKIAKAVIEGDEDATPDLTKAALDAGLSAKEILDGGLMPGMDHVGVEFKAGRMFVPEVLLSARTMKGSMAILELLLAEGESVTVGKVIIGTVQGDLHDIGKNLVAMMMEGAGFQIVDLGTDVSPEAFVDTVKKEQPDIVGMSALLTTTMRNMGRTIDALKEAGLRDQVKVMVGGAPVTSDFAKQIGADGTASSAPTAVDLAKGLLGLA